MTSVQFNSYQFILVLLPAFVVCYFLLSRIRPQLGKLAIIAFSVWFYAVGGWQSAAVLGGSMAVNLLLSFWLSRAKRRRKGLLALIVAANVLLLLWFKYYGFAVTTLSGLLDRQFAVRDLFLPLGISFFTFQQIAFAVSVYRGALERVSVPDYLSYILFFPKLTMGPLAEPADLIGQFNDPERKRPDWANIACGLKLFGFGLFKKLVLADTFVQGVRWGFGNLESATAGDLFLVMLCYTLQIYFDFSGYSDMATGVAKMINVTLPINFDSPLKATSVKDFWKRWHLTLTGFLTKYVYFPLGGSRKGAVRTYVNILLVFLISGMWHGANWTFLLWGALHGVLMCLERLFDKPLQRVNVAVRWLFTFLTVALLRMLFLTDTIAQWGQILGTMFSFQSMAVSDGLLEVFLLPETGFLLDKLDFLGLDSAVRGLPMLVTTVFGFLLCMIPENNYRRQDRLNAANMILCAIAFAWAFLCLGSESVFVYFNF